MAQKPIPGPTIKPARMAPTAEATAERLRPRSRWRPVVLAGEHMLLSTHTPVDAVIDRAVDMGLMTSNTQQVGARLPMELLEQAKRRTGIASTTDLLAFALANVAVEDNFATAFVAARGKLDPNLDVDF